MKYSHLNEDIVIFLLTYLPILAVVGLNVTELGVGSGTTTPKLGITTPFW
jgi:hypothetical protein